MANDLLRRGAMLKRMLLLSLLVGLSACKGSVEHGPGEGGHAGAGGAGEGGSGEGGSSAGGGGEGGSSAGGGGTGGTPFICAPPKNASIFEIGTGEDCFSRVAANEEVPLMSGPQGGYHVWLAIGCQDCKNPVHLKYGAFDPATGLPLPDTWDLEAMVPLEGVGWPQAAGLAVNMPGIPWDPEAHPPLAKGTHVVLWAKAYDGEKIIHEGEIEVVIGDIEQWDPCAEDPEAPVCQTG